MSFLRIAFIFCFYLSPLTSDYGVYNLGESLSNFCFYFVLELGFILVGALGDLGMW